MLPSYFLLFMFSVILGSSSIFLIHVALFVMCLACFAGTALKIFNKSRDKSAGYAVLVSGDQK